MLGMICGFLFFVAACAQASKSSRWATPQYLGFIANPSLALVRSGLFRHVIPLSRRHALTNCPFGVVIHTELVIYNAQNSDLLTYFFRDGNRSFLNFKLPPSPGTRRSNHSLPWPILLPYPPMPPITRWALHRCSQTCLPCLDWTTMPVLA
jgi:hypothetical protein